MLKFLIVYPFETVGKVIDIAQGPGEDPYHVAIFTSTGLLQALFDGVVISSGDFFAGRYTRTFGLAVPQPEKVDEFAAQVVGEKYDYFGAAEAWIYQHTKLIVPLDVTGHSFCSDLAVRAGRYCGGRLCADLPAYCVDPKMLLAELLREGVELGEE